MCYLFDWKDFYSWNLDSELEIYIQFFTDWKEHKDLLRKV